MVSGIFDGGGGGGGAGFGLENIIFFNLVITPLTNPRPRIPPPLPFTPGSHNLLINHKRSCCCMNSGVMQVWKKTHGTEFRSGVQTPIIPLDLPLDNDVSVKQPIAQ